jgi:hypothetical protein
MKEPELKPEDFEEVARRAARAVHIADVAKHQQSAFPGEYRADNWAAWPSSRQCMQRLLCAA